MTDLRTAVQLHTLQDLDATLPELIERVGASGFEAVEFAGGMEGDADVAGCVRAAAPIGVTWLSFEHDRPTDPVASTGIAAERPSSIR